MPANPFRTCASAVRAVALLASVGAGAATGQSLTGRLLLPSGAPATGVLLVAVRTGSDSVVRQAATTTGGRFTLALPPQSVRLRALRIGHRPTELGAFTLASGERREVTLHLVDAPIQLRAQVIAAARRCRPSADAGEAVVTLLQEVRTALTLSTLRPQQDDLSIRLLTYSALAEPDGDPLGVRDAQVRIGNSSRPFQSLPPALLSQVGYVSEQPGGTVYRAPDAQLFLSHEAQHRPHPGRPVGGPRHAGAAPH